MHGVTQEMSQLPIPQLKQAIRELPDPAARDALWLRYGLDGARVRTLSEVARQTGLDRRRLEALDKQMQERMWLLYDGGHRA